MKKALKKLQSIYSDALTTNEIKAEAWNIRGITGNHFRLIVSGSKTNGKPFSEEEITGCIQALKQAYKNDTTRRNKFNNKLQNQVA